ncbi:MAG: AraC family transcriptional regulator [Spirochaetales bacterium]|nr:AraC family transcriptional regulator [Spirochaetales bacterium]
MNSQFKKTIATRHLYHLNKPGHMTCFIIPDEQKSHEKGFKRAIPEEQESAAITQTAMPREIYSVSMVLQGQAKVKYRRENKVFSLKPGSLFQFNGHTKEDVYLYDKKDFWESGLMVDGKTGEYLEAIGCWRNSILVEHRNQNETLIDIYKNMIDVLLKREANNIELFTEFLNAIAGIWYDSNNTASSDSFKLKATNYLSTHCTTSESIAETAGYFEMSYEAFRKKFTRAFKISPQEFQIRCRMEKACTLLMNHSVKETALRLNYSDPFVFSRQFSKRMSMSPREYIRLYRN